MPDTDPRTPNHADRETAMRVMAWDPLSYDAFVKAVNDGDAPEDRESLEMVNDIAQALADQRAEIIARFTELADEIDANARLRNADGHLIYPARDRRPMHDCAEAIRRVVRDAS
jgi:hypothetical protein